MPDPSPEVDAVATDPPQQPSTMTADPPLTGWPRYRHAVVRAGGAALIGAIAGIWWHQGTPLRHPLTLWYAEPQGVFVVPVTARVELTSQAD